MSREPLAVSVGCPSGIGPEVAIGAAATSRSPLVLVGDEAQLREIAAEAGVSLERHRIVSPFRPLMPSERAPGSPSNAGGAAQLAWVDAATDLVIGGEARALVTGPVSKAAIAHSGAPGAEGFLGHTEHLQRRLGADEVVMAFWSKGLVTSLVTTHVPLARVPNAITAEGVAKAAFWLAWLIERTNPGAANVVVVASLNPHAGEGGLLGDEETRVIAPGVELGRVRAAKAGLGATFVGPTGAETAFRKAIEGVFAGVVAMYHDQATIPHKVLGFGEAVNVSLGLPIIRTSVDHGTGYDVAAKGLADAKGMSLALALADRLSASRRRDTDVMA